MTSLTEDVDHEIECIGPCAPSSPQNALSSDNETTSLLAISPLEKNKDVLLSDHMTTDSIKANYFELLRRYRPFRMYLMSYLISQAGEWFTYVACIELMEQALGSSRSRSRTYISLLVVSRVLPSIVLAPIGGILADSYDRMNCMIYLDLLSSMCPFIFILAEAVGSKELIFVANIVQTSLMAMYQPSWSAIVPMMVDDDEYLKKATTLMGLAWSLMAALGSALGGAVLPIIGLRSCFFVDSISFQLSALILWSIGGDWLVAVSPNENEDRQVIPSSQSIADEKFPVKSLITHMNQMTKDGVEYLSTSSFGALVFIKCTGGLIYGACDVLNVSFAEEGLLRDNITDKQFETESSNRLGILFFMVGAGCLLGPLVSDPIINVKRTETILYSCVFSFGFMAIGCLGMGYFKAFEAVALFTLIRSAGSSVEWIYSSLLLQIMCKDEMLGRVSAIDYGLATASEALSALMAGFLQDDIHMTAREVGFVMSIIAFVSWLLWLHYALSHR